MEKTGNYVDLGFTRDRFPAGTHMCLIYSDEEERKRIIAKYLEGGLISGERVSYFADRMSKEDVLAWIREAGADMSRFDAPGNFDITVAQDTYCPDGMFVPERMHDNVRRIYMESVEKGFTGVRASGEMAWATRGIPGSDRLMEYEALLNLVLATHPLTAICQYNAHLFDGATIFSTLKVHPMMIVHGQVLRNPYYLKPDEVVKELSRYRQDNS